MITNSGLNVKEKFQFCAAAQRQGTPAFPCLGTAQSPLLIYPIIAEAMTPAMMV